MGWHQDIPSWRVLMGLALCEGDLSIKSAAESEAVDILVYDNHVQVAKSLKVMLLQTCLSCIFINFRVNHMVGDIGGLEINSKFIFL